MSQFELAVANGGLSIIGSQQDLFSNTISDHFETADWDF
jgi:hypothetical protein